MQHSTNTGARLAMAPWLATGKKSVTSVISLERGGKYRKRLLDKWWCIVARSNSLLHIQKKDEGKPNIMSVIF